MRAGGPRETPRVTDPGAESVPLVGSHGSGHARTSPSGGSAALCAPVCHGKGQGRRISPRMGVRVTDSGPKASPSQGPAVAEGGICHERGRGRRSCHRTHRGRNRTPREAARGDATPRFPGGIFSPARSCGSRSACTSPSGGSAALCAAADRGKHQRRRISPRTGPRATDSGPKASPLRGPAAAGTPARD